MDKIAKALNKLTNKEQTKIKNILIKIKSGNIYGFDFKKLKNKNNIYRIRSGNIRIIFKKEKTEIKILAIERRSDITYN